MGGVCTNNKIKSETNNPTQQKSNPYDALMIQTNIQLDISVPTSPVDAVIQTINLIHQLLKAFNNRNEFTKALQRRVDAIDGAVKKLQTSNLQIADVSLKNLSDILNELQEFILYVQKNPPNFFEKTVKFFNAQSDLKNLARFDNLLTRALADLQIPLQTEQLEQSQKELLMIEKLQNDIQTILNKMDQSKLIGMAKRHLTNELALSYWLETNPTVYECSTTQFQLGIKEWFETYMNIKITRQEAKKIAEIVNQSDNPEEIDEFITAKELNNFFNNLPCAFDVQILLKSLDSIDKKIKEENKFKSQELQKERNKSNKIIDFVEKNYSEFEKEIQQNENFVRFLAQGCTLDQQKVTDMNLHCVYIFFDGTIRAFGGDELNKNFELKGKFERYQKNFNLYDEKQEGVNYEGLVDGNQFIGYMNQDGRKKQFQITLDLKSWVGFYEEDGNNHNQGNYVNIYQNTIVAFGIYKDFGQIYVWQGKIDENNYADITETHVFSRFTSKYQGQISKNTQNFQILKGNWSAHQRKGLFNIYEQNGHEMAL